MDKLKFVQSVRQLPPIKGAYFYFVLTSEVVESFSKGRKTRLVCTMEEKVYWSCGLNQLGDGNFFIIVSKGNLAKIGKGLDDAVSFTIEEDPNPLGVEVPEFIIELLAQDEASSKIWNAMTDGKKRSLIYTAGKIKNLDLAVERTLTYLEEEATKLKKKGVI